MSGMSPAPYEVEERRRLKRYYAFPSALTAVRNTFTGAAIAANNPGFRVASAGAIVETNKIAEFGLEQADPIEFSEFSGPGSTVGNLDFRLSFRCQMYAEAADKTRVNSAAFAGIELGSAAQTVLTNSPAGSQGVIRLEQRLDSPTDWRFFVARGDGSAATIYNFTVPDLSGGLPNPGGAFLEIYWDPYALATYAIVNGQIRAAHTAFLPNIGAHISDRITCGLILYSGTQSLATSVKGWWQAASVISYNTGAQGSGLV